MPEPHAAETQHRVRLVELVHLLQHGFLFADVLAARLPRARPRPPAPPGSGRNSCSGGSSSRTVTGSPLIAREDPDEVLALQRQQRVVGLLLLLRRSRRRSSVRTATTRSSPRNMCSVRHRPIPSAPRSRAFVAWSGVSALARTRSRRRVVGDRPSAGSNALPDLLLAGLRRRPGARLLEHRLLERQLPHEHVAGEAVDRDRRRPRCTDGAVRGERPRRPARSLMASAPRRRGDALAPRHHRRVTSSSRPALVRMPSEADHPVVVGPGWSPGGPG